MKREGGGKGQAGAADSSPSSWPAAFRSSYSLSFSSSSSPVLQILTEEHEFPEIVNGFSLALSGLPESMNFVSLRRFPIPSISIPRLHVLEISPRLHACPCRAPPPIYQQQAAQLLPAGRNPPL